MFGAVSLPGATPLARVGERVDGLEPVMLVCGLAVLSAGLVVLKAAQTVQPALTPATVRVRAMTADEAMAERSRMAGETDVLVEALASAAATFYAIAGHLPRDVSERVVGRADDLRELVWLNRGDA